MRLSKPAEKDAQHGVGVSGRANGGAGIRAHALLVNDDGGGQAIHHIDIRTRQGRHETLDEGAVGFIDHPLGFCGNRPEDQ